MQSGQQPGAGPPAATGVDNKNQGAHAPIVGPVGGTSKHIAAELP
jgi:hypothetical protein